MNGRVQWPLYLEKGLMMFLAASLLIHAGFVLVNLYDEMAIIFYSFLF